jgi:hypothetical protein
LLDAPAGLAQFLTQIVGVVADSVAIRDQSLDSTQRPTLVLVTEGLRAALQISQDLLPLRIRQVRLTPLMLDALQALQAAATLFYLLRPLTDSATADAQATRDLGMGEVAFTEKATTFHPSFFNLFRS